jgi:hypothetical protein
MEKIIYMLILLLSSQLISCTNESLPIIPDKFEQLSDVQTETVKHEPENEVDILPGIPTTDIVVTPEIEIPVNIYSEETIESFFNSSAFVGDSVMHGLTLYSTRNKTSLSGATFLTMSSFAARHALSEVTEKSYHPTYNGQKMKVEDAMQLAGTKRVFISLGLNDVRVTPYNYFENYIELIDKIREKNPEIEVYIMSTTYPVQIPGSMDAATASSYREQLVDLNSRMKEYCIQNNMYFIDTISMLTDESGFLSKSYSSDNYVHLTNKAYSLWTEYLKDFANQLICTGSVPGFVYEHPYNVETQGTVVINDKEIEQTSESISTEAPQADCITEIPESPESVSEQPNSEFPKIELTEQMEV